MYGSGVSKRGGNDQEMEAICLYSISNYYVVGVLVSSLSHQIRAVYDRSTNGNEIGALVVDHLSYCLIYLAIFLII